MQTNQPENQKWTGTYCIPPPQIAGICRPNTTTCCIVEKMMRNSWQTAGSQLSVSLNGRLSQYLCTCFMPCICRPFVHSCCTFIGFTESSAVVFFLLLFFTLLFLTFFALCTLWTHKLCFTQNNVSSKTQSADRMTYCFCPECSPRAAVHSLWNGV